MKSLTKGRVVLYLAILFLAGAVTGAVIAWGGARHRRFQPPSPDRMKAHFRHELATELQLTPVQLEALEPILDKRTKEMEAIHTRSIQQIEEVIRASNAELISALGLSPEQRAKLDAMEQRRRDFMRKHMNPRDHAPRPAGAL